jgi:hypothetical protein
MASVMTVCGPFTAGYAATTRERGIGCDGDLAAVAYVCIWRRLGGSLRKDDDGLGGIGNE